MRESHPDVFFVFASEFHHGIEDGYPTLAITCMEIVHTEVDMAACSIPIAFFCG